MSEFIRWKEVDILTYLPLFIAKDLEFKAMSDADSREHERIRLLLIELLKQDNIQSATYALDKWEEFVGITTKNDINSLQQSIDEFKPAHIGYEIWEEQLLNQNLIILGLVMAEEETQIGMSKLWGDVEIEHTQYYGSVIGYEEVIEIGG